MYLALYIAIIKYKEKKRIKIEEDDDLVYIYKPKKSINDNKRLLREEDADRESQYSDESGKVINERSVF